MIERLRVRIPAGAAGKKILCVLTFIRCPFHPRVTAVAGKRSGHSAKSAGGRLHLNAHTPLTQRSRSGLTMPPSRHSVGTYPETSSQATCQGTRGHSRLSQLAEPLWTDPGLKSGIRVRELTSTLKQTNKQTNKQKSALGE